MVFTYKKRLVRVRLLCAVVGRFVPAGGFGASGGGGRPREMRYAVPAGSVYFFKLLEGGTETVNKLFHGKCLSDYRETQGFVYKNIDRMRYCDRGFGYCLTGNLSESNWKEKDFSLVFDVQTSHFKDYYDKRGKLEPTDDSNPVPISFPVLKNTSFKIVIGCTDAKSAGTLLSAVKPFVETAFKEYGIGAKTSLGCGW